MSNLLKDLTFLKNIHNGYIGIMGGSFNPPHQGHLHISELAIKRLGLNLLVWLVTPANPLKHNHHLLDINQRLSLCNNITSNNYKIKVSILENDLLSNYTYDTIVTLRTFLSKTTKLFWVMGEDLLFSFHKFYRWKDLTKLINIVIISRGGIKSFSSLNKQFSNIMADFYISPENADTFKNIPPPSWTFWPLPNIMISSTQIRNSLKND